MENTTPPVYADMVQEVECIVQELESGTTDLDALSGKVKRALTLLDLCAKRLREEDAEIARLQTADSTTI